MPLRDLSAQPVVRSIDGGFLIQDEDCGLDIEYRCVHQGELNPELEMLQFGSMVTKHLKSNAISLIQGDDRGIRLLGAGMGNPNRLVSTEQATAKANDNVIESEYMNQDISYSVLISDAFFPFRDNVDLANEHGIKAIVQPVAVSETKKSSMLVKSMGSRCTLPVVDILDTKHNLEAICRSPIKMQE